MVFVGPALNKCIGSFYDVKQSVRVQRQSVDSEQKRWRCYCQMILEQNQS